MTSPDLPPIPPDLATNPAPTPQADNTRIWIILTHLSFFFGGIIAALAIYLIKKDEPTIVRDHAREVLNFQLSFLVYSVPCFILMCLYIGIFLFIVLGIVSAVFAVVGAVKASEGVLYRYPIAIRFIK